MSYSLNEVEATVKKAARGAGYGWGHAEEAGKVARWLSRFGLDGCRALAELLESVDGVKLKTVSPRDTNGVWRAEGSFMCPLLAGTALSDRAHIIGGKAITLFSVAQPLLLLPFAHAMARQSEKCIGISWSAGSAQCDGATVGWQETSPEEVFCIADAVEVSVVAETENSLPAVTRIVPRERDWSTLLAFAHRTYAPATEESRLLGAGAGTTDND